MTKYYCENLGCNNEIDEPKMCCSGHECGCMGQPIEPPYCSAKCMHESLPFHTLEDCEKMYDWS